MEKLCTQLLVKMADNSNLMPILAAAGASGLAGGYLTSQSEQRPNETPGSRRWRILRNAMLTAGAGGGAAALGMEGMKQFSSALPQHDVDPVTESVTGAPARALFGGIGGIDTYRRLNKNIGKETSEARKLLYNVLGQHETSTGQNSPTLTTETANRMKTGLTPDLLRQPETGKNIRDVLSGHLSATGAGGPENVNSELAAAGLPVGRGAGGGTATQAEELWNTWKHKLSGGVSQLSSDAVANAETTGLGGLLRTPRARALGTLGGVALGALLPNIVGAGVSGATSVIKGS